MKKVWKSLGVGTDELKQLVRYWKRQKWLLFQKYMPKPTLKIPVDIVDQPTILHWARVLREKWGIDILQFSLEELKENRTKTGEKIGKLLRKMVPEKDRKYFDNDWNRFRRCFINGTLIITVALDELVIISNPANWSSCHAIGKEKFYANFSYALDSTTVLIYLASNDDVDDNLGKPVKLWRMLAYWLDDYQTLITSRQYPYDNDLIYQFALKQLKNIFFSGANVQKFRPLLDIIDPAVDDSGFFPYLDTAYFEYYGTEQLSKVVLDLTSNIENTRFYKNNPVNIVICARCGAQVDEYHAYIDDNGDVFCSYCWEHRAVCDICGDIIWTDSDPYEMDADLIFCANCAANMELKTCPICGRSIYIECWMHEIKCCWECAKKLAAVMRRHFYPLPFYNTDSANLDLLWDLTYIKRVIPN